MGEFDFIIGIDSYSTPAQAERLSLRHDHSIKPFKDAIAGAKVLDLAAHDGRWSYALAQAGARRVLGIEARQELVDGFKQFPKDDAFAKVDLMQGICLTAWLSKSP